MPSGIGSGNISGRIPRARRGRLGACGSAGFRLTGGWNDERGGFFTLGGLCLGVCLGGESGAFFGGVDLEGVEMIEKHYSAYIVDAMDDLAAKAVTSLL